MSYSILQAHCTVGLTLDVKYGRCSLRLRGWMNRDQIHNKKQNNVSSRCRTLHLPDSNSAALTDPPCCSGERAERTSVRVVWSPGRLKLFRAEPNNSNSASWLSSLSFFSSLFSTSSYLPLFLSPAFPLNPTQTALYHISAYYYCTSCLFICPHFLSPAPWSVNVSRPLSRSV